jgi:uncharacterized BrkB/YihY/UPF0761 family membrane protein
MSKRTALWFWFFLKNTLDNFFHDNGFFLTMGLAFNLLLYFIPLALLLASLLGYTFLESERAMAEVQSVVRRFLPQSEQALADNLAAIVANRGLLGLLGSMFFFVSAVRSWFGASRSQYRVQSTAKTELYQRTIPGLCNHVNHGNPVNALDRRRNVFGPGSHQRDRAPADCGTHA